MSYDVWLDAVDTINHTSNTAKMWRTAGVDLAAYNGKRAWRLRRPLRKALRRMYRHPRRYKAMNPPNGWGSYETTLQFLESILVAVERYPSSRIWVSR